MSKQRNAICFFGLIHINLNVNITGRCMNRGQVVQQSAFILTRFNCILLSGDLIDNGNARAGMTNAVAQLGGEIPLNFFSREGANSFEQSVYS